MLEVFTVSGETAPDFSGGPGTLTVVDNRTGKKYESKISKGGTVKAMDFKKVNKNKIKVFPAISLSVCSQRHRVSTTLTLPFCPATRVHCLPLRGNLMCCDFFLGNRICVQCALFCRLLQVEMEMD